MTAYLTHTPKPAHERCAACGAPLTHGYYFLRDRAERYCPNCIATRPRCDSCSAPIGDKHWTLHDRRVLCSRCHATAILDPEAARMLFDETVAAVMAQLGLSLRVGVEFRLIDAPSLARVRASGEGDHAAEEKTLGLYQKQGLLRAIYVLYGLPKLLFRTVVAHEYTHAWQAETCPLLDDDELREGFAEWVAYHHLLHLGATKAAQRMLVSSHPYRPMLERVVALERRLGSNGVIQYMLEAGRGIASA